MKKLFAAVAMFCIGTSAFAQFSVEGTLVPNTDNQEVAIVLSAPETACAFQFNLAFPEGITFVENSQEAGDIIAAAAPAFSVSQSKDGSWKMLEYDMDNTEYSAAEGSVIKFKVNVGDIAEGNYDGQFTKASYTKFSDKKKAKFDDAAATFVVTANTGIESVSVENNAPVYNLNGMLMNGNLQKGVYVQNGKKFIVK
jgi:hypothetical protein